MAGTFGMAYYVGTQLPARFGRKIRMDPVSSDTFGSRFDLVGRFRLFEDQDPKYQGVEKSLTDYLNTYCSEAQSEVELIDNF